MDGVSEQVCVCLCLVNKCGTRTFMSRVDNLQSKLDTRGKELRASLLILQLCKSYREEAAVIFWLKACLINVLHKQLYAVQMLCRVFGK